MFAKFFRISFCLMIASLLSLQSNAILAQLPTLSKTVNSVHSVAPVLSAYAYTFPSLMIRDATPQYPISLSAFDGTVYMYHTDCCKPDGHTGVLLSSTPVSPLGCKIANDELDEVEMELTIPPPPGAGVGGGGGAPAGQTISIFVSPSVKNDPNPPEFKLFDNKVLSDYYQSPNIRDTAIKLMDANNNNRVFTLVRYKDAGSTTNGQPYSYEFPMLILSRQDYSFKIENVGPFVPKKQIDSAAAEQPQPADPNVPEPVPGNEIDKQPNQRQPAEPAKQGAPAKVPDGIKLTEPKVDFTKNYIGTVEIEVADPNDASKTIKLKCLMIHRT